jgi:hypothetical protein
MRFVGTNMIVDSVSVAWLLGGVAAGHAGVSAWTSSWNDAVSPTSTVVRSAYAQSQASNRSCSSGWGCTGG